MMTELRKVMTQNFGEKRFLWQSERRMADIQDNYAENGSYEKINTRWSAFLAPNFCNDRLLNILDITGARAIRRWSFENGGRSCSRTGSVAFHLGQLLALRKLTFLSRNFLLGRCQEGEVRSLESAFHLIFSMLT